MPTAKIKEFLSEYPNEYVETYTAYILSLANEKDKTGKLKNPWMGYKNDEQYANLFKRVFKDGLVFDGKHITLQSTGVSYDYVAYKNKMLLAYPESKIDMAIVYEGDDFSVSKETGSVVYQHNIAKPFNQKDSDIIGAYCVISNKRGDFITLLSREDLDKHRKVAKTDFIWATWLKEMVLKTIIKKACKQHFNDIYESIDEVDNDNYDLEIPLGIDLDYKKEIDAINNIDELREYYKNNTGKGKDFNKYVVIRKEQLLKAQ